MSTFLLTWTLCSDDKIDPPGQAVRQSGRPHGHAGMSGMSQVRSCPDARCPRVQSLASPMSLEYGICYSPSINIIEVSYYCRYLIELSTSHYSSPNHLHHPSLRNQLNDRHSHHLNVVTTKFSCCSASTIPMLFLQYISQVINIGIIAGITLNIYLHTRSKGEQRFECLIALTSLCLTQTSIGTMSSPFYYNIYRKQSSILLSSVRETSSFESSRECNRIVQVCWVCINLPSRRAVSPLFVCFFTCSIDGKGEKSSPS